MSQSDRRSRPSSVVGSESPPSKSNDNIKHSNRKVINALSTQHRGSIKKRSAPAPPPKEDDSSGSNNSTLAMSHNRTASDSGSAFIAVNQQHWRNNSIDLATKSNNDSISFGNKPMASIKTNAQPVSVFVSDNKSSQLYGTLQRPKCAPPPAPDSNRLSNGQSIESLPSISSESEDCANRSHLVPVPVPPPRKVIIF